MKQILKIGNQCVVTSLLVLLLSCEAKTSDKSPSAPTPENIHIDTIPTKDLNKKPKRYLSDTIYSSESLVILGDNTIQDPINDIYLKFEPYIGFSDFKTKGLFKGNPAPIDFNSNPTAKRYKTRITDYYKEVGVNFASYYSVATWGCGSSCQFSALVDARTGKVYNGPEAAVGFDYRLDSRMLIVNPPDSTGLYLENCAYCHPQIFIWNEEAKKFEEKLPRRE